LKPLVVAAGDCCFDCVAAGDVLTGWVLPDEAARSVFLFFI
jgi:hypothetical protein